VTCPIFKASSVARLPGRNQLRVAGKQMVLIRALPGDGRWLSRAVGFDRYLSGAGGHQPPDEPVSQRRPRRRPADCLHQQTDFEYERIRDFLILHYHVTQRTDSAFWNYVRTTGIPDSLQHYIDLFVANGQFFRNGTEMFGVTSWVQVMLGQGLYPRTYHPAVEWVSDPDLHALVDHVEKVVASNVSLMPPHEQFIARFCAAPGW